jgi:hypothetical protein
MFEALGYQVTKLLRVRIGSLWLGDLEPGDSQALNESEIAMLLKNPKVQNSAKLQTKDKVDERIAREKASKARAASSTSSSPGPRRPATKSATAKPKPAKRGRPQAEPRSERSPKRPGSKRHQGGR